MEILVVMRAILYAICISSQKTNLSLFYAEINMELIFVDICRYLVRCEDSGGSALSKMVFKMFLLNIAPPLFATLPTSGTEIRDFRSQPFNGPNHLVLKWTLIKYTHSAAQPSH